MRALRIALASLVAIFAAAQASAQIVDVAKISCKQYLTGKIVRQDYLTLWLSGYLNGTRNDTVIETGTVQHVADKVGTYCRANLDAGLMDAVQNVLGAGK
ncbi:MAG TPA: HdeA/HdeB family chaperone [Xanthobacteraceae bacterium]|nr:HdeA/HdeB family chaperone [Xanthobacteraceae bacterium]